MNSLLPCADSIIERFIALAMNAHGGCRSVSILSELLVSCGATRVSMEVPLGPHPKLSRWDQARHRALTARSGTHRHSDPANHGAMGRETFCTRARRRH